MAEVAETVVVRSPRELDVLVAEKVMGWRVDYDSYQHWTELQANLEDLTLSEPSYVSHGMGKLADIPSYSTSIADAWQVVEKVCPRTDEALNEWFEFNLELDPPLYTASFSKHEIYDRNVRDYPFGYGDDGSTGERQLWRFLAAEKSVCTAICLAALKTVGVEVTLELNDAN